MEEFYQHRMDTPAQSFSPAEETLSSEAFQPRKGMSQSRSEGSLNYRQPPPRIRTPFEPPPPDLGQRPARMDQGYRSPSRSPIRGRGTYRTPSPTKLDDIKEGQPIEFIDAHNNEAMEPLSSPGKRSRSPMKQMFGEHGWLGRSTSMKELPSDEYRKTGIKHWGEKIKLRVNGMVTIPLPPF